MNKKEFLLSYWHEVAEQNEASLKSYFTPDASICWHDTKEQFTVDEFIIANCEYPGKWRGEVERMEITEHVAITVTRVWLSDNSVSFHVVSFFQFSMDKIAVLDEYWGEEGTVPQWRQEKHIGKLIK